MWISLFKVEGSRSFFFFSVLQTAHCTGLACNDAPPPAMHRCTPPGSGRLARRLGQCYPASLPYHFDFQLFSMLCFALSF
jgi:hypothetical protein